MPTRRILLLELVDADGATAWSECVAGELPNYTLGDDRHRVAGDPRVARAARCSAARSSMPRTRSSRLLDREHPRPQHGEGRARDGMLGTRGACMRELPLSALLGGTRDRVADRHLARHPGNAGRARRARRSPPSPRATARSRSRSSRGATSSTCARCAKRSAPDIELMADANSAYTLDDADHLAQLDAFDLIMIEQPLGADDLAAASPRCSAGCTRRSASTSRSPTSNAREDMIALGSGRIINIKPGRVGGFAVSKAIHDVCAERRNSGVVRRNAGERRSGARTTWRSRRCRTSRCPAI